MTLSYEMNNRYKILISVITQQRVKISKVNYLDEEFLQFIRAICPKSKYVKHSADEYEFYPKVPVQQTNFRFQFSSHLRHFIDYILVLLVFFPMRLTISGQAHHADDENILNSLKIKVDLLKKFKIEIDQKIELYSFLFTQPSEITLENRSEFSNLRQVTLKNEPKRVSALIINQGCNDFVTKQLREYLQETISDIRIDMDKRKRPKDRVEDIKKTEKTQAIKNTKKDDLDCSHTTPNVGISCMIYSGYFYKSIKITQFDSKLVKSALSYIFEQIIGSDSIDEKFVEPFLFLCAFCAGTSSLQLTNTNKAREFLESLKKHVDFNFSFEKDTIKIRGSHFSKDF